MRYLVYIGSLIVLLWAAAASADARQHFMAGQSYYTQGNYQKAIEEFKEAYRLDPKPLLLFNLAQSYEKLGNLKEAITHLERYLEADPNTEQRATLLNKIENLKSRVAQTGITVTCDQADAAIYVDDVQVGTTPVTGIIAADEGAHKVRISKSGFVDFVMNVAVATGQSVPIDAKLEPVAAAAPLPAAEVPQTTDSPVDTGAEPESDGGSSALKVVPWVIAGVGAAAAITGLGVIGGIAMSKDDHSLAVVADIVGWPGVALAVGGTVWGLYNVLSDDEASGADDPSVAILPIVGPSDAYVAATVRF